MYEIAFWFCLMEMAKKKNRNPKTQMHMLICIYAHMYTHINTQHILSCPPGQFRSSDTNTFKKKSMAKKKKKKQSPLRRIEVKRDLQKGQVERYRRLLTAQESIHFQNSWKGFKGVFRGVQFISFSTMTVSVELPWNIPQLYMINQPPHAIMFHSPNII